MIIDFHCHAGRGDQLTAPWTAPVPLSAYLRRARRAGIDLTVVMPSFPLDSQAANREIAALVGRHPDRLVGFAWIDPRRDRGRVADLVAEADRLGLRGVKVHGHVATPGREVCEAALAHGFPLLLDVASRPHVVDLIAATFRQLPLIVAHLGSFVDDWRAHRIVIDQLTRHRNVYADTSGVRRFDMLREAVRRAGAGKLLFGSDGPWLHPALELEKVRLLRLAPAAERLMLGGNAAAILRRRTADQTSLASSRATPQY
jgi:predicted TIM-barrel fold metal-dependent hydrolase